MKREAPGLVIAVVFFFGWLAILLAGADKPPPPPFLLVVLIDLLTAAVVYWRVPTYIEWSRIERPYRLLLVLGEGFAAGLMVALLGLLLPMLGEPSVQLSLMDYLIWFVVLGAVGALNAAAVYGVGAFFAQKAAAKLE